MLGVVPHKENIHHCTVSKICYSYLDRKKILNPDITKFVKCYKYTLTVEKDNFAMKGKLLVFRNICGKMYENCWVTSYENCWVTSYENCWVTS